MLKAGALSVAVSGAQAKAAGYHIAILTSHEVPDYLQSDPAVQKVDIELLGGLLISPICQQRNLHS